MRHARYAAEAAAPAPGDAPTALTAAAKSLQTLLGGREERRAELAEEALPQAWRAVLSTTEF